MIEKLPYDKLPDGWDDNDPAFWKAKYCEAAERADIYKDLYEIASTALKRARTCVAKAGDKVALYISENLI